MNYRHHFHAGNFADVMKHTLLVRLIRALQKKEKGFLYLDTHAGRGAYDLEAAASGDTHARQPEWPEGVGRLWPLPKEAVPPGLVEYFGLLRDFDQDSGNSTASPRFYPGSPWLAQRLARPVDRLAFYEKQPMECAALRAEFAGKGASVQEMNGYVALRALLPPPERRALVLIDPPFEAQDEFAQIATALREGLERFPMGVFAVWYPLTGRARVDEFFAGIRALRPPPTLACELTIAGERSLVKMKGCGLLLINPPWQFEAEAVPLLEFLAGLLRQESGGSGRVDWIVSET